MMKKVMMMVVALLFTGAAMADDAPIEYAKTPKAAQTFIAKNFPNVKVMSATKDYEISGSEYTVYLEDGTKVDFNKAGAWKEVKRISEAVPATIIPARIAAFVAKNYAGQAILKIDVDRTDYELKLANGFELKFDLQGNFIGMDD